MCIMMLILAHPALRRNPLRHRFHTVWLVCAQAFAAKPICITAATPIVRIMAPPAFGRCQADRLAIIRITALPTDHQPLQQIALAAGALPATLSVLRQLLARRLGQREVDQGWNRHADPRLRGHVEYTVGAARLFGTSAHRAQAGRQRTDPGLAKGRRAGIGGVLEDAPHGRSIPSRLAAAGWTTLSPQPSAHLADADALVADPL